MNTVRHKGLYLCLVFYIALSFFRLDSFPKVWGDESWIVVPPRTLAVEGRLVDSVCGAGTSAEEHVLAPAWVVQMPLAAMIRLFGVHVISLRGVSVIFGLLALIALGLLLRAHRLNLFTSVLIVLVTITDNVFFVSSRTLRPEIHTTFVAVAAFYFLYRAIETREQRYWVLSGIVVGIGSITHPVCILLFLGLLGMLLLEYKLKLFGKKEFWTWIAAATAIFLPFAIHLIAEDLANGFRDFHEQMTAQGRGQPISGGLAGVIKNEGIRYLHFMAFPRRIVVALVTVLAAAWACMRRDKLDQYILIVIAAHLAGFTFLFANKSARYFTVLVPFLSILVVRMVLDLSGVHTASGYWRRLKRLDRRVLAGTLIMLLYVGNQFGGDLYVLSQHRNCDYSKFVAQVRDLIPEGKRTWGSLALWLGLSDHPYRAEYTLGKDLESFKPEYVILYDSDVWGGRSSTGRRTSSAKWKKVRVRLESLAQRRGTSVGTVPDACYGDVEIFRIDWNSPTSD